MPLDLEKERINVYNFLTTESTQVFVESDVIVPDAKPDISLILQVKGDPYITEERKSEERIIFKGVLAVNILYHARRSDRAAYSITSDIPFEDYITIEGLTESSSTRLTAMLEHLEYTLVNDRKVNIKAVIKVTAEAWEKGTIMAVSGIAGNSDIQVRTETIPIGSSIHIKDLFPVSSSLVLPEGNPNIYEILDRNVHVRQKATTPGDEKTEVSGILHLDILYTSDNTESMLETASFDIPFSHIFDSPGMTSAASPTSRLLFKETSFSVAHDEDGEDRVINISGNMITDIISTQGKEQTLVTDAYSLSRDLVLTPEEITFPSFLGYNVTQSSFSETLMPQSSEMLMISTVDADAVIDNVTIEEDKLIVDGVINLSALYLANDDALPVNSVSTTIPFSQEIEVQGARPGMLQHVNVSVEDVSFNMLSPTEAEVRTTLSFDARVDELVKETVLTDIADSEANQQKDIASVVIYVVQRGDSLWTIAKKYNTTVDDIIMINDIENPDQIFPGERILIIKTFE